MVMHKINTVALIWSVLASLLQQLSCGAEAEVLQFLIFTHCYLLMNKLLFSDPLAGDKTIFQELEISKASARKAQNGHVKLHATAVPDELPAVLAKNFPEQASEIKKRGSGFVGSKKKQAPSKPHKTDQDLLKEALAKVWSEIFFNSVFLCPMHLFCIFS